MVGALPFFKDQVTTDVYLSDVFYMLASMAIILAVLGLGLIDAGLWRAKNQLDNWVQKIVGSLLAGLAFMFVGYGIWNWQFDEAFGVPNAFDSAINSWWIGGDLWRAFAHTVDPAVLPTADVFQVFALFFLTYAMVIAVLIHGAGHERLKPVPFYVMAVVSGGIMMPLLTYFTWGSASPLTNRGVHDYVGIFSLYMYVGVFATVLAWRLGPRLGAFKPHPRTTGPQITNWGFVGSGVVILMFAIPFIVLGCGYIVPGAGYFGISMTTSGFGIAFANVFMGFCGGAVTGTLLAYLTRNPAWALFGPIGGYVSGTALFDITVPWKTVIVALFAPPLMWLTYVIFKKLGIDEPKIAPLTLLPSIYGAIVAGFIGWHVDTGGYFGLKGEYGFQHAQITPYWQLVGVGVTVGMTLIAALIVVVGLEKTIGIRVKEEGELAGLDTEYWGAAPAPATDIPPGTAPAATS